jgi:hypothetical protein
MPHANRQGPNPAAPPPATVREYIAGLQGNALDRPIPSPAQMAAFTKQAYEVARCAGAAVSAPSLPPAGHPIPAAVGGRAPSNTASTSSRRNRTYDQVFGDVREGNGDPDLAVRAVMPNHHALAREFVLLDNFVDAGGERGRATSGRRRPTPRTTTRSRGPWSPARPPRTGSPIRLARIRPSSVRRAATSGSAAARRGSATARTASSPSPARTPATRARAGSSPSRDTSIRATARTTWIIRT